VFAHKKLKSRREISVLAEKLKKEGKIVVTVNGSFDMLHAGHLHILEEAKKQGDVLIVGLNSDKSVKIYKSKDRPIIPEDQRAALLCALECVDYVTLFDEPECLTFVESIKPHVHVNGSEYGPNCIEAPLVKKYGGRLHIVQRKEGTPGTSKIIEKILNVYCKKQ